MSKKPKHINYEDKRASKTILGSTENSNFILNMTIPQVQKWIFGILVFSVIAVCVGNILVVFAPESYELPMMFFSIGGIAAMIFAFIAYQKKMFGKSHRKLVAVYGILFLLGCVSLLFAKDISYALKGAPGRGEGLLTIFVYGCFYLIATLLAKTEYVKKFLNFLVIIGLCGCGLGILQMLPFFADTLNQYYSNLQSTHILYAYLPYGVNSSPIVFAEYLAIVTPVCLFYALFQEQNTKFYLFSAFVFIFFMLKTAVLMGWVGVAVSVILLIAFLVKKIGKVGRRVLLSFTVLLAIGAGSAACYFLPKAYDTQNYINFDNKIARDMVLYDTGVIWQDSNYRIFSSGYLIMSREEFNEEHDADMNYKDVLPTYEYQWSRTLKLICRTPYYLAFGVGPENIALALLGKSYSNGNHITFINNFDKPYNDYLYIIATRGIFSLLFYVIFLMLAFNAVKNRENKQKHKTDFTKYVCVVGAIIYLILSIIGFSNIEITPIFFILLGFAKSTTEKEEDTK